MKYCMWWASQTSWPCKEFDGKGLKSATKDSDGDDELKAESGLEDCRVALKFKLENDTGMKQERRCRTLGNS